MMHFIAFQIKKIWHFGSEVSSDLVATDGKQVAWEQKNKIKFSGDMIGSGGPD